MDEEMIDEKLGRAKARHNTLVVEQKHLQKQLADIQTRLATLKTEIARAEERVRTLEEIVDETDRENQLGSSRQMIEQRRDKVIELIQETGGEIAQSELLDELRSIYGRQRFKRHRMLTIIDDKEIFLKIRRGRQSYVRLRADLGEPEAKTSPEDQASDTPDSSLDPPI